MHRCRVLCWPWLCCMCCLTLRLISLMDSSIPASVLKAESNAEKPSDWHKRWSTLRYVVAENPLSLVAAGLFTLFVLLALIGPMLAPYDPLASNVGPLL